ncbi:DUF6114 domain-containing protein [Actinoplanes regularis]|uniref:DUF6114 domain-containing protein n=1 Tax=Actinoplanes regularis TaxID=52697 RepID=UPI0024A1AA57|nr:DUF6114 domain-containing protein [Actinoplanes regularis]GLW34610.1 hypothetical protein Areg01_75470 [Actinoplanes regularis]
MSGIVRHRASPGPRAWRGFGDWRHSRPFWGGLLVLLGGVEILFTVWAPLGVVLHVGMQNFIGYMVPFILILLGLLLWFNPAQRLFYALMAMLCGLGSFLTSNMGGFIIGLLFTVVGAALAFAWAPDVPESAPDPAAASASDPPAGAAPAPDPATASMSDLLSGPAPAPAPEPAPAPALAPEPAPAPAPGPVPASGPAPAPASGPVPASGSEQGPAPAGARPTTMDRNTPPPEGHWRHALPPNGRAQDEPPVWNVPGPRIPPAE